MVSRSTIFRLIFSKYKMAQLVNSATTGKDRSEGPCPGMCYKIQGNLLFATNCHLGQYILGCRTVERRFLDGFAVRIPKVKLVK